MVQRQSINRSINKVIACDQKLYSAYILPVLLYGTETWALTKVVISKIDSFDLCCQHRILRVHYSHHISNCEIRNRTGCTPATDIIRRRRLQLFGHIARSEPEMDHRRALRATIRGPVLTGNDLEGDQDRHGLELLKTIWNLPTLVCTRRGGERKIVLTGGTSWRQQRSTRDMLLMMMMTMYGTTRPMSNTINDLQQYNANVIL